MRQEDSLCKKFIKNNKQYYLQKCKYRMHDNHRSQQINIPTKRYSHTSVIYSQHLYVFGGTKNSNEKDANLYIFNLKNMEWSKLSGEDIPQSRDSHGCAVHKHSIYIYGGSTFNNHFQDIVKYHPIQNKWTALNSSQIQPPQRDLPIFLSVNDQYIFLYGGINMVQQQVYNDAYIFVNQKWLKLDVINPPPKRIGASAVVCGMKIYLFGGQAISNEQMLLDDLYQATISEIDLQIKFKELIPKSQKPSKRAYHGMVEISRNYFAVVGGQISHHNTRNYDKQMRSIGDIWIYDIFQMTWIQIQPINGSFKSLQNFSIASYQNKIYIFGGLRNTNTILGDLLILSFQQQKPINYSVCDNCYKMVASKTQGEQKLPKNPIISIGFLHQLALEIKFAFQAISLLIDGFNQIEANDIKIMIQKQGSQCGYIHMEFNGNPLSKEQFHALISNHFISPKIKTLCNNFTIGGLRLGKTIVIIFADQETRKVYLFSADNRASPLCQQQHPIYMYMEDIYTGTCLSNEGCKQKQLIINILQMYTENVNEILSIRNINRFLIFAPNILMTAQKIYYYELISYTEDDIRLYKNPKKLQFLYDLNLDIYNNPQLSLKNYLILTNLCPTNKISINDSQPLQLISYLKLLQPYIYQNKIKQINSQKIIIKNVILKINIFYNINNQYLNNNHGIMIYYQNRLINRYQCQFGKVFSQKFYKSKFKKQQINLWNYLGVINIIQGIKPNITKTSFEKSIYYISLLEQIQNLLINHQATLNCPIIDIEEQQEDNKK